LEKVGPNDPVRTNKLRQKVGGDLKKTLEGGKRGVRVARTGRANKKRGLGLI